MGRPFAPVSRLIPVPAEQAVAGKARHSQQGFPMARALTLETAADLARKGGDFNLASDLQLGQQTAATALIRQYVTDERAQTSVIEFVEAAYALAVEAATEGGWNAPEAWGDVFEAGDRQLENTLADLGAPYSEIDPAALAIIEAQAEAVLAALVSRDQADEQGDRARQNAADEAAPDGVCLTSDAADHASGWRYMTGEIIGIHGVRSARVGCYRLAEDGHAYVHQGTVSLHVRDGQEWMPLPELHRRAQAELRADEDAAVLTEIIASL